MEKEFTCAVCDKKFLDDFEIDDGYKLNFSLCPKCGKSGKQNIHQDSKDSPRHYLEYIHVSDSGKKSSCHIGRVRSGKDALEEFNEES